MALARRAHSEFAMGTVHGVTRLERDDLAPGELLEVRAQLGRRD
jgi:hypothetical protein